MSSIASRQSPLGTIAQSLPRIRSILGNLRPTWHMRDLTPVDAAFVRRNRIAAFFWDVDGTLTRFHDVALAPEAAPVRALLALPGLHHAIVSNADERRFLELGTIFPELAVVKGYRVDGQVAVRQLVGGHDAWTGAELASRLAAGAVPLRKPDGDLLLGIAEALGLEPAGVVMVGDQYFTDIAGANLAGMRSIKLPAIGVADLPPGIRFGQRIERAAYRLLHGRPRWESPAPETDTAREQP